MRDGAANNRILERIDFSEKVCYNTPIFMFHLSLDLPQEVFGNGLSDSKLFR